MFQTLRLETDARGVATLTLDRAEKKNALSAEMIAELHRAAEMLGADAAVRAVILQGAGGLFCAGGDLRWMQAQMQADDATRAAEARKLAEMLGALNRLPKPLIGRIEGAAFGGGVGLACVCDIALSAPETKFGLTETRLGLIPATIGPYVLARLGEGAARQVFMSGRVFGAEEAQRLGVVARVSADLDRDIEAEIAPYLACAPGAVAEAKALALQLGSAPDIQAITASIEALVTRWKSRESEEGISAFFDKRPAEWVVK